MRAYVWNTKSAELCDAICISRTLLADFPEQIQSSCNNRHIWVGVWALHQLLSH